ncbi:MAG: rRNA maturation RNase YbeY [Bacilli bacterium]|nr:rRNA maturation RNase YbeY [Bacilli bacterium]
MNKYEIFNETKENIDIDFINELLEYALKYKKIDDVIFNIIFVDNKTIRKINKEYRNIDSETDVISFALEDTKDIKLEIGRILGDIYISIDKVKDQAKEYGHSEKREMAFLTIHGLLHLLGYDHITKEEEKIMFKEQELILDGYGIKR